MSEKDLRYDSAHVAEIEATVAELPLEPPEHTVPTLIKRGGIGKNALIYRAGRYCYPGEVRTREAVKVICTVCRAEIVAEKSFDPQRRTVTGFRFIGDVVDHWYDELCECPECHAKARAVHVGRFGRDGTYGLDGCWAMTVHNVRGHLALLQWQIEKRTDKTGNVFYNYHRNNGTLLIDGVSVRVCGWTTYYGCGRQDLPGWERRTNYTDGYFPWKYNEVIPFDPETVWTSDSPHCALEDYIGAFAGTDTEFYPTAYLRLWTKHPNAENLVRSRHSAILNKILYDCFYVTGYYGQQRGFDYRYTRHYIDWKRVRPHEMLGIEKGLMKKVDECEAKDLAIDGMCRANGVKPTAAFKKKLEKLESSWKEIKTFVGQKHQGYKPNLQRLVNYLAAQKENYRMTSYLGDYWRMLHQFDGSMPEELIWPKDLHAEHDRLVMRIKEKEDEKLTAAIAAQAKKNARLVWADPKTGLCIRPAESHSELIKEGKVLHHCVATYAKSVAEGRTCILFVRHANDPEIPFFTLEYRNGSVSQNLGDHNCARTSEVIEFEKRWLEHLKNYKKKKERIEVNG